MGAVRFLSRKGRRQGRRADLLGPGPYPADVEAAARRFLLLGVLPLWVVPGLADWWMHRRTGIERTSGAKESAVHAAMMTEAGVPVVVGLLARVKPLVLTTMGASAVAHSTSTASSKCSRSPLWRSPPACTPTRSARPCAADRNRRTGACCPTRSCGAVCGPAPGVGRRRA